ncbi:MAG TPA: ADOP family duplicated permease [Candidatus Eremiobacteraceae bacterium]|nr:ADOP family duplicated permease [Candidatus Eremiobacteraceae bacterium]
MNVHPFRRVLALFRGKQLDHELDEEISTHLSLAMEENLRRGMSPDEARRQALVQFGGPQQAKENHREARSLPVLDGVLRDLRFAARVLRKSPAFSIIAVLTLALGIGANSAIFSVVRGVLFRPLANQDEDRLLYLRQSAPGIGEDNVTFSVPEIQDLGGHLRSIKELGTLSSIDFTLTGLGEPREIRAGVVDGNYFQVMGLHPVLGRLLNPIDDGPNAAGAAVLTYRFWTNTLHSDRSVLGKVIRLGSQDGTRPATIVGVLQPAVPYPVETQIIANIVTSPHHLSATMVTGREHRMTEVFARIAPGATLEAARAELHATYDAMLSAHPDVYKPAEHFTITVSRIHDQINSKANAILWVLFAASALLFVIACSNVANLILARTVRREPEFALRSALGASASVLRRALLAESLLLCAAGTLAGIVIAAPMVSLLAQYASRFSARAVGLTLDSSVLWTGVALALAASVFLAFVPHLPSNEASRALGVSSGGSRVSGGSHRRLRIFAVTQITASFLLLAGAGALLRTLLALEKTQPPFETARVLAVNLPVMTDGRSEEQVLDFYRDVQARISGLPGVEHVSTGFTVPWRDSFGLDIGLTFSADGAARINGDEDPRAHFRSVSPGFFATLGMPILEGRDFNANDRDGNERVVIISQTLAKELFPGQNAVNREMRWTDPVTKFIGISNAPRRIIGVVPDLDDQNIIPRPFLTVYQPTTQEGWNGRLLVRAKSDPYALVPSIVGTIREMAADQPVERASTLEDVRAEILTPNRLNAVVFGGFAGLALLISVVGVAGVLAFSVSSRTREFGIRMALGAQPHNILTNVLLEGLAIAGIGVLSGVFLGFASARATGKYVADFQLPGVLPLVLSAAVILAAAVIASVLPAIRAATVDAVEALRSE